jgi:hypothetical protein
MTNDEYMKTISIPVIFNDGTKGIVVLGSKTYLSVSLPQKLYYDVDKGYMHIDEEKEYEYYSEEYISEVKRITILYFAGKLQIENPFFELTSRAINKRLRSFKSIVLDCLFDITFEEKRIFRPSLRRINLWQFDLIEIAKKMDCPPLGGTWQKYFNDKNWLIKAEKIKGESIFLT